jgi:hypothetical protein
MVDKMEQGKLFIAYLLKYCRAHAQAMHFEMAAGLHLRRPMALRLPLNEPGARHLPWQLN